MPEHKLHGIRVQMARMLEIYSLLRDQLAGNQLGLSAGDRERLQSGIDTIASNMRDLLTVLTQQKEETSAAVKNCDTDISEAKELEEILNAVIKWHAEVSLDTES
jgi:hypothetical protein